ncbi:MAG: substrate-binding domain-containing protein [Hyphomicrobiaceae bacterium]
MGAPSARPDLAANAKTKGWACASSRGSAFAARQPQSGTHQLLVRLLDEMGIIFDRLEVAVTARTESEVATSVLEGKAEVAFGLESLACQFGLSFVPVIEERFDLLIDRRAYFEPPMQTLLAFCRTDAFMKRAGEHIGYDLSGSGRVHFNGP